MPFPELDAQEQNSMNLNQNENAFVHVVYTPAAIAFRPVLMSIDTLLRLVSLLAFGISDLTTRNEICHRKNNIILHLWDMKICLVNVHDIWTCHYQCVSSDWRLIMNVISPLTYTPTEYQNCTNHINTIHRVTTAMSNMCAGNVSNDTTKCVHASTWVFLFAFCLLVL